MNTIVNFELAKHLKENRFDKHCKYFYDEHGNVNDLTPHEDYKDLYSYDGIVEHYFSGEYNWNSLDVNEGMEIVGVAFGLSILPIGPVKLAAQFADRMAQLGVIGGIHIHSRTIWGPSRAARKRFLR